jgi:hypothetical protein
MWNYLAFHDACDRVPMAGAAAATRVWLVKPLRPCSLPHPNPKYFLFHPSHQIFQRMHGAFNVGKKDN